MSGSEKTGVMKPRDMDGGKVLRWRKRFDASLRIQTPELEAEIYESLSFFVNNIRQDGDGVLGFQGVVYEEWLEEGCVGFESKLHLELYQSQYSVSLFLAIVKGSSDKLAPTTPGRWSGSSVAQQHISTISRSPDETEMKDRRRDSLDYTQFTCRSGTLER
ncbi:hypothetical protein SCHPADRAFT_891840 [Schizopora paradoxa]|uniref:Uncharacterized protein n=1 Tax=Schizopora paradoxa TaxID=27342 RepID=A0A0H2RNT4_9AGAM|nr:hypothetical protein SCHPADRAFT_891840 [Schizopora paradoxa]